MISKYPNGWVVSAVLRVQVPKPVIALVFSYHALFLLVVCYRAHAGIIPPLQDLRNIVKLSNVPIKLQLELRINRGRQCSL